MHVILTITAIHDRSLQGPLISRRTIPEIFHWSQCAKLLNWKLSQPILPEDRDPLWATAAILGIVSLSSIEGFIPEESWPLKPSDPSDLAWLRMSEGKMAVWNLTDPLRSGSIFNAMSKEYQALFAPIPMVGIDDIPATLVRLCNLDKYSTCESNPYFVAAHTISGLQGLSDEPFTRSKCLNFISHMQQPFKNLLQEKDPVALLLLALWYTKVHRFMWFIQHRATVESQSILLYLHRYHKDNRAIRELLPEVYSLPFHTAPAL
jgi:hypothetical protein